MPEPATELVKLKINGREIQARKGQSVLQAALDHGIYIPHFCWHPGLSPDGNCRMCLAKVEKQPKPVITCRTTVAEGMVVDSEHESIVEARKGVMEFLLINHPLDCPVCDQAGECVLQDYSYEYGRAHGRFRYEDKNVKQIRRFGPEVSFWGTRCIVCTRCVRFCQEVSGTSDLATVNRGDHNVIDLFPGTSLDHELSLNTVDVCPVGALVSSEFLFSDRWWHMRRADSICTHCSKGCNTMVEHTHGEVRRIRPRPNPAVNGYWMCNWGRFDHKAYLTPGRLKQSAVREAGKLRKVPTGEAVAAAASALKAAAAKHGRGSVAGVATAVNSCEELGLFAKLMDALGADVRAAWGRAPGQARGYPGFKIPADRNPNTPGVRRFLGEHAFDLGPILQGIESGRIKAVFYLCGVAGEAPPAELARALAGIETLVVQGVQADALSEAAQVVLAAAGPFEADGEYVNGDGISQRARAVVAPPGYAEAGASLLAGVLESLGAVKEAARVS